MENIDNNSFDARDGTGQKQRHPATLDPAYFQVDERSVADLMRYAQALGRRIRYFGMDETKNGVWSAFLEKANADPDTPIADNQVISIKNVEAYLRDPEAFAGNGEWREWLSRPHFALYLVFLEMTGLLRSEMNLLTKRHLDFYYREILGLKSRPATPDELHVLLQLAKGVKEYVIPSGSLLQAGKDARGRLRSYRTNREIVVNRTQVAEVRNVFVERRFQSLEDYFGEDETEPNPFVKVLRLVYDTQTDGSLKPFNNQNIDTDTALVNVLKPVLDFSQEKSFLALSEFRRMVRMNDRRNIDLPDWTKINDILTLAGRAKRNAIGWNPAANNQRDFSARFKDALGFDAFPPANAASHPFLSQIQGVNDLFDLYEQLEEMLAKRTEKDPTFDNAKLSEFTDFLNQQLFMPVEDKDGIYKSKFRDMMSLLDDIRRDWAGINRWLVKAGSKKQNKSFNPRWPELPSFPDFPDIDSRITAALVKNPFTKATIAGTDIVNANGYWNLLKAVELYFFLPFEDVKLIIDTCDAYHGAGRESAIQNLPRVFALLEKAYTEKAWSAGLKTLKSKRESDAVNGFIAMLNYALGEPEGSDWPMLNNKSNTKDILQELKTQNSITELYLGDNLFMLRKDFDDILLDMSDNPLNRGEEEWQRLYRLLESARRVKRGLSNPVPGKEHFLGIFSTKDATSTKTTGDNWRTFGDIRTCSVAEIGLAFCSPLLQMAEGERVVTLNLIAEPFPLPAGATFFEHFDFSYWFTTSKGWINCAATTDATKIGQLYEKITITITVPPEALPVTAPAPGLVSGDPAFPVLKMVLSQTQTASEHPYRLLKNIILKKILLNVKVQGLSAVLAQNPAGSVDTSKSFEPFGHAPQVGSDFLFAHPEICFKPISKIGFNFQWKGIINDLTSHYRNYDVKPEEKTASAQLSLRYRGKGLTDQAVGLFNQFDGGAENNGYKIYNLSGVPELTDGIVAEKITDWSRYWTLELNTDFRHAHYPRIAAERAMDFAVAMNNNERTLDKMNAAKDLAKLNPPYIPNLNVFKLYYEAAVTILDVSNHVFSSRHAVWHLHPFGNSPLQYENRPVNPEKQFYLLPDYPAEGSLYIGLRDSEPMQQVSLLFQMAEGSADPDLEKMPVEWSCLAPQGWQAFDKGEILLDETDSLSNSGILQLILPENAARQNPMMPPGLHWLRATIAANRGSVCDTIGIYTQAMTAIRMLDPESPDDPGQPLPPDTVKGFYERQPGIKKVEQPFVSFGGRSVESDLDFYARVSERLRHRQRPLTQWDIERLILQEFPDVYKAKCLVATDPAVGEVKVVVVPDIRGKVLYDAYQPKMPVNRLSEIGAYLETMGAPLASFLVVNPVYIILEVRAFVRFRPGYDPRYYLGRLDEELRQFLAPWAFEAGADIAINHTIYPSVVINFIEERPYIDFVTGIRLFQTDPDGNTTIVDADSDGIQPPTRPDAIWVSARKHFIELVEARPDEVSISYDGIELMRIEYDFLIA